MTQQAPTNKKKSRHLLAVALLILCIAYFSWDSIVQIRQGSADRARRDTQSYSAPDPEAIVGKPPEPDRSPDATIYFLSKRGGGGVVRPKKAVDR